MGRRFRTALLWLIAWALPLQGFAAGAMLFCGSAHATQAAWMHIVPGAAGSGAGHHHGPEHDHDPGPGDGIHSAAPGGPAPFAADEAGGLSAAHLDHLAHYSCSVCASCCPVTGPPSSVAGVPFAAASFRVDFALPVPSLSFLTDGPDRPPRLLSV